MDERNVVRSQRVNDAGPPGQPALLAAVSPTGRELAIH